MRRLLLTLPILAAACGRDAAAPTGAPLADRLFARPYDVRVEPGISIDFENFTAGAIDGQFDWKSLGGTGAPPSPNTHCAVYDHVIAENAPGVPYRSFGHRSLRISNAVTSGCYSDQTFSSRTPNPAGQTGASSLSPDASVDYALPGGALQNHFEAEWSFASTVPGALQPGLEVVASPARGDATRMSWVQMVDRSDGLAVVFAERSDPAQPGAFLLTTVASRLDRTRPHTIRLTMDFVDGPGNDVVQVSVDGDLVHTGTSWENYYFYDAHGRANFGGNTPIVNRMMFRTGSDLDRGIPGDPAPATRGHGFVIDNVRLATFNVPRSAPACRNDRWRALRDSDGEAFGNEGDCIRSVNAVSRTIARAIPSTSQSELA